LPDGTRIVFSAADAKGRVRLWMADLSLRFPPREFASTVNEDQPSVDDAGNVYFRAAEGGSNFLYRMKEDGSGRAKALANPIFEFDTVSPNGQRAVVLQASSKSADIPFETMIAPLDGGPPTRVCPNYCNAMWGNQGRVFAVNLRMMEGGKTILIPVEPAGGMPRLPSEGFDAVEDPESSSKGFKTVDKNIVPGPDAAQYAWLSENVHRNLYRIPVQ
jgi:hypothetical protein